MPPDPLDAIRNWNEAERHFREDLAAPAADFRDLADRIAAIAQPPDPVADLDEWRATYGRLDLPVTVIDWRTVYAGAAALGIALVARWIVRHGR